jgi:SET domain-containing protein
VFKGEKKHRFSVSAGDLICPYDGEILSREQMDDRRGTTHTAPYGIQIRNNRFEDSVLHRGVGSLINHKAIGRGANCEFVINRNQRIDEKAIKDIRNGEELFVSYGNRYALNESNVKSSTNNRKYGEGLVERGKSRRGPNRALGPKRTPIQKRDPRPRPTALAVYFFF